MTKSSMLLAAAILAGPASAFAPALSARQSTCLNEEAFCRGYVGGEGPEPMPFGSQQTSKNWDPLDFVGVSCKQMSFVLMKKKNTHTGETLK